MPFGPWSITEALYDWLRANVEPGRTIVELGSGDGTELLCRHWEVYTVEHDPSWLDRCDAHYIFAPLVAGWYDPAVLADELPASHDVVLVDGPPGFVGRSGLLANLALFRRDAVWILDDVHRPAERALCEALAAELGRASVTLPTEQGDKQFAVIPGT